MKTISTINHVCVIGGSGFVGRHIVHLLQSSGYSVRVPSRRYETAKELIVLPNVDVVEADVHEPAALAGVLRGMDAVINLTGILHEGSARRDNFQQAHVALPRMIVQACLKQGIQRLVHMSALNVDARS